MSNKAKGLALSFAIWILPAIAVAEMVSPWCGYGAVPEFGIAGGATVEDDNLLCWGTDCDAWLEWDTATTPDQLSLNNTDCDGGGTDCVIWYTEAGSPDLFVVGGAKLKAGQRLTLDSDAGANTYIYTSAGSNILFYVDNTIYSAFGSSSAIWYVPLNLNDNVALRFGTGADQTLTYTDGTGVTWFDGTNTVLTVPDDSRQVNFAADVSVAPSTKGAKTTLTGAVEDLTCAGGGSATLTTSGLIPDGAFLLGVTTRVTTALTGPTGYTVGDGSDVDLYAADPTTVTQGTTTDNSDATATWGNPQLNAGEVTITMVGSNCTAGVIRVVAHYQTVTAPTSN